MSQSRRDSGALPLCWWMRCANTFKRCWMVVPSDPAIHHGAMPWYWWGKRMGCSGFCIDFLCLNARTKKDAYPLPHMQETMESMVGTQHFSCMDLKSGFWQVKMAEESRQYTTFTVGSMGVYEFLHMPYGLCNAPAMFQQLLGRAESHVCLDLPG